MVFRTIEGFQSINKSSLREMHRVKCQHSDPGVTLVSLLQGEMDANADKSKTKDRIRISK